MCNEIKKGKKFSSFYLCFIRTNPFKDGAKQYNASQKAMLTVPTNDGMEITKQALAVLERLYKEGFNYKKQE